MKITTRTYSNEDLAFVPLIVSSEAEKEPELDDRLFWVMILEEERALEGIFSFIGRTRKSMMKYTTTPSSDKDIEDCLEISVDMEEFGDFGLMNGEVDTSRMDLEPDSGRIAVSDGDSKLLIINLTSNVTRFSRELKANSSFFWLFVHEKEQILYSIGPELIIDDLENPHNCLFKSEGEIDGFCVSSKGNAFAICAVNGSEVGKTLYAIQADFQASSEPLLMNWDEMPDCEVCLPVCVHEDYVVVVLGEGGEFSIHFLHLNERFEVTEAFVADDTFMAPDGVVTSNDFIVGKAAGRSLYIVGAKFSDQLIFIAIPETGKPNQLQAQEDDNTIEIGLDSAPLCIEFRESSTELSFIILIIETAGTLSYYQVDLKSGEGFARKSRDLIRPRFQIAEQADKSESLQPLASDAGGTVAFPSVITLGDNLVGGESESDQENDKTYSEESSDFSSEEDIDNTELQKKSIGGEKTVEGSSSFNRNLTDSAGSKEPVFSQAQETQKPQDGHSGTFSSSKIAKQADGSAESIEIPKQSGNNSTDKATKTEAEALSLKKDKFGADTRTKSNFKGFFSEKVGGSGFEAKRGNPTSQLSFLTDVASHSFTGASKKVGGETAMFATKETKKSPVNEGKPLKAPEVKNTLGDMKSNSLTGLKEIRSFAPVKPSSDIETVTERTLVPARTHEKSSTVGEVPRVEEAPKPQSLMSSIVFPKPKESKQPVVPTVSESEIVTKTKQILDVIFANSSSEEGVDTADLREAARQLIEDFMRRIYITLPKYFAHLDLLNQKTSRIIRGTDGDIVDRLNESIIPMQLVYEMLQLSLNWANLSCSENEWMIKEGAVESYERTLKALDMELEQRMSEIVRTFSELEAESRKLNSIWATMKRHLVYEFSISSAVPVHRLLTLKLQHHAEMAENLEKRIQQLESRIESASGSMLQRSNHAPRHEEHLSMQTKIRAAFASHEPFHVKYEKILLVPTFDDSDEPGMENLIEDLKKIEKKIPLDDISSLAVNDAKPIQSFNDIAAASEVRPRSLGVEKLSTRAISDISMGVTSSSPQRENLLKEPDFPRYSESSLDPLKKTTSENILASSTKEARAGGSQFSIQSPLDIPKGSSPKSGGKVGEGGSLFGSLANSTAGASPGAFFKKFDTENKFSDSIAEKEKGGGSPAESKEDSSKLKDDTKLEAKQASAEGSLGRLGSIQNDVFFKNPYKSSEKSKTKLSPSVESHKEITTHTEKEKTSTEFLESSKPMKDEGKAGKDGALGFEGSSFNIGGKPDSFGSIGSKKGGLFNGFSIGGSTSNTMGGSGSQASQPRKENSTEKVALSSSTKPTSFAVHSSTQSFQQQQSGFGQSASVSQQGGFGQYSGFGQSSGFGQPSAFGQQTPTMGTQSSFSKSRTSPSNTFGSETKFMQKIQTTSFASVTGKNVIEENESNRSPETGNQQGNFGFSTNNGTGNQSFGSGNSGGNTFSGFRD